MLIRHFNWQVATVFADTPFALINDVHVMYSILTHNRLKFITSEKKRFCLVLGMANSRYLLWPNVAMLTFTRIIDYCSSNNVIYRLMCSWAVPGDTWGLYKSGFGRFQCLWSLVLLSVVLPYKLVLSPLCFRYRHRQTVIGYCPLPTLGPSCRRRQSQHPAGRASSVAETELHEYSMLKRMHNLCKS